MSDAATLVAGRYRLREPLGSGGMGRVWLAVDEVLNREVAVKEVLPAAAMTEAELREIRPRAIREARAAARLNHPNAVKVYDVAVTDAGPWIVMEYVPSRSLAQLVHDEGPLPPQRAAQIGLAVLAALRAAHKVGVLHRDVKPGNVLLTPEGRAVLTDFGLATIVGDPSVTSSGVILGSPAFMAPERAQDRPVGPATDLWSLGATLYYAVHGRAPYERGSAVATLAALASEDPPAASNAGPLAPVIDGLLHRDPGQRLDAAAAERMLRAVADRPPAAAAARARATVPAPRLPEPALVAPPTVGARVARRGRMTRLVVAAVLVAVVATVVAMALRAATTENGAPDAAPTGPVSQPAPSAAGPTTAPEPAPTTQPTEPAEPTEELPAGWHVYTDQTGFSVAVPESWPVTREGTIVYFREPGGPRVLGIDQTDEPQPDPVADWAGKEAFRVARGDFPGYERIRLEEVDYFLKAADWEFTYDGRSGRVHVNNRGFITAPDQAYGMWWSTPDDRWEEFRPDLERIQRSFRPAP